MQVHGRSRWLALIVVCIGDLMIVLDATIVNVALPSIKDDLGFSDESLAWVVNAYLLTFGGFMLLGGRLGDIYGARRMFLAGLTLFTLASLACGVANSDGTLVAARAVQGIGGAIVAAIALALLMKLFTEPAERAKAMGVFGFVVSAGGTLGVLLGGVLTDALDWHWIFLVNLPIGIAVFAGCLVLLPKDLAVEERGRLDIAGAVTVTVALMLAVYAIVNGNEEGWGSGQTLALLAGAALLLGGFLLIETRASAPLVPLELFRHRTLATANVVAALLAAAMFSWFFLSALYLQLVLGYSPLEVGLAFLPATLLMGAFSLGLSAKIVMRFGIRAPLVAGLGFLAAGLLWFARAPVDGSYAVDVLPSMILLALGAGLAFNPLLLAAMGDVTPAQSGLASGLVNTTQMMGGALGLAILASLAAARTDSLLDSGTGDLGALNGGYHAAFVVGAIFAIVAMILVATLMHAKMPAMGGEHGAEASPEPAPEHAPEATPVGERG
jgi:EmrB/QacA subfamily drug resistance transporter